jgi:hypothetical protein
MSKELSPASLDGTPPPVTSAGSESQPADQSALSTVAQVYQFLTYGLSLPERALRGTSALVGGAVGESAELLVPQVFRSSKSYNVFVQQMLDFMIEDVGGVQRRGDAPEADNVEAFVARKTVGGLVDMVSLATLHLSPLTVLAIVSDVAYGSQSYLNELSAELKRAGVIDEESTIDHAGDLLDALGKTASQTADAFDTPPLSLAGLQDTISQTHEAVAELDPTRLIPQAEMEQLWNQMHDIASRENVGLLDVSGAMALFTLERIGTLGTGALSTAKVTGNMFDRHVFDHYRQGLNRLAEQGFYAMFADVSRPYINAVWENFHSDRATITEGILSGRLLGRAWHSVRGWVGAPSRGAP